MSFFLFWAVIINSIRLSGATPVYQNSRQNKQSRDIKLYRGTDIFVSTIHRISHFLVKQTKEIFLL